MHKLKYLYYAFFKFLFFVQQQALRLFEGVAVPSLEQRREAAAIGLTCRLIPGNVKQPLKPLTPKMRNPNEDQIRRSIRLKGPIQQHKHQLQSQWRYLKGVTEVESPVFGTDRSQNV